MHRKETEIPWRQVPDPKAVTPGGFVCQEIEGIFGGLGSGKSNHALSAFIWPELTAGIRTVVTNLPINRGSLRELIQRRTLRDGSEVDTRLRIIPDTDCRNFYFYRGLKNGQWWSATLADVEDGGNPKAGHELAILSYNVTHPNGRPDGGVLYVIDEAHNSFRARSFAHFSLISEWYFTHVRKQGDTVVLCTPHPMQIDTFIRNMFQNVWTMRNSAKERFMTFFRGAQYIYWKLYTGPFDSRMQIQASGHYTLDVDLANCYDTSGGANLVGAGAADKGRKPKGLPFWTLFAFGIGAVVALVFGLWITVRSFEHKMMPSAPVVHVASAAVPMVNPRYSSPKPADFAAYPSSPISGPALVRQYFDGLCGSSNDCWASLWGGEIEHGRYTMMGRIFVSDDGVVYHLRGHPRPVTVSEREPVASADLVATNADVLPVPTIAVKPALISGPVSHVSYHYR